MTMTADAPVDLDDQVDENPPAGEPTDAEPQPGPLAPAEDAALLKYRGGILTIRPDQARLSGEQRAAMVALGIPEDVPPPYVAAFVHLCQATSVDPFLKQATIIRTRDGWAPIIQFNGLKGLAEATRQFQGFEDVEYWSDTHEDFVPVWRPRRMGQAHPDAVRTGVRRGPSPSEFTVTRAVVNWEDYAVYTNREQVVTVVDGRQVKSWRWLPDGEEILDWWWSNKGPLMLGKCGQAAAVRNGFPIACGAWWVEEEMGRARQEGEEAARHEHDERRRDQRRATYAATSDGVVIPPGMQRARDLMDGVLRRASADRTDDDVTGLTAAYEAEHNPMPGADPEEAPAGPTRDEYRQLVLAELRWQAEQLGQPVEVLTAGMALAHPEPLEEWDPDVVLKLVAELRPAVARRLEAAGRSGEARTYRLAARDEIATVGELLGNAAA